MLKLMFTFALSLFLIACEAPAADFVFPGWERIPAVDAAAYCEARDAVPVEVPVTEAEIREATDACVLAEETGPCWVGTPSETEATVITIDGNVIAIPRDLGPALALCRVRVK